MGALGALINNVEHFIGKDGNVTAPNADAPAAADTTAQEQPKVTTM